MGGSVGTFVGIFVVGAFVGCFVVGDPVGKFVGIFVVGAFVGSLVGAFVRNDVGARLTRLPSFAQSSVNEFKRMMPPVGSLSESVCPARITNVTTCDGPVPP